MYRRGIIFALLLLFVLSMGVASAQGGIEDTLKRLVDASKSYELTDWRWMPNDVAGAQKPDFDDSKWRVSSPEFDTGPQAITWMRKVVTIPDAIGGVPVAGSRIYLHAGIDDDGECFVNGNLKQQFHWDQCRVLLTEKAQPGDKFVVALKAGNGPGNGRLMFAELESSGAQDWRNLAQSIANDVTLARQVIAGEKDKEKQAQFTKALEAAVNAVDITAIQKRDMPAVQASLANYKKALEPMSSPMKDYVVHLIGHAHIDMNWLWLWPETVDVCKNTFSTMIKIMDQYPDFKFSQSQASTYYAMEQQYPELFAQIQQKVKEGRWEVTGGTWVEGDMNMASGEAITRQIMYAKRYFLEKFGVESQICWEPDTFGHAWTVPQILAKSGIKYYYFCRCAKDQNVFWWEGPDGSRVLAYTRGGYGDTVNNAVASAAFDIGNRYGVKDGMVVYGVGDHGGGPTMNDLNTATQLQKQSVFPTVKFDTTKGFYTTLLDKKKDWPVIRDELNFTFQGCYTTHADIKRMNRISESLLPEAETFSSLAGLYGLAYPQSRFVDAWRNTCFNQFHDIFDGSAIHGSYEYSTELFNKAHAIGSNALQASVKKISEHVDTSKDGTPIVVFNPLGWERTDIVRLDSPIAVTGAGSITDARGKRMPTDIVDGKLVFTAAGVPSVGYKVFYLHGKPSSGAAGVRVTGDSIENEFYAVHVDPKSGTVTSILDKKANREVLPAGANGDQLQILFEKPHGMSAWDIGPIRKTQNLSTAVSVEPIVNGSSMGALRVKHTFGASSFSQDITLYSGVQRIDFRTKADWQEVGSNKQDAPMLKVAFPVAVQNGKATFEIPFGSIERPANGDEVPGQKWIDFSGADYGVSLLNDCKYGHDVKGNVMRLTLLRAGYEPDPTPDVGRNEFTYSLYPHAGDWRKADTVRRGYELNNPLTAIVAERHPGKLGASHSFVQVDQPGVVVTALKKAEDSDDFILRMYECKGAPVKAKIGFGMNVTHVQETDLSERPTKGLNSSVSGGSIAVPFGKWEIKTLKLSVAK